VLATDRTTKGRLEAGEIRCLRAMPGYGLIKHMHNEGTRIREQLQAVDTNSRIKDYQIKWLKNTKEWSKILVDFIN
jgi:hypothetical protein